MANKTKSGYDFGGYATRFNVRCDDGRTILPQAFADQDGQRLTLADSHGHSVGSDALGYVDLELRHDGMYCWGSFNNTEKGKNAKIALEHGDYDGLSIWANKLTQNNANEVVHGVLREVSLVMAGCNPGAYIDTVTISHGAINPDDFLQDAEAIITPFTTDRIDYLGHAAENNEDEEEDTNMANNAPDPKEIWESMDDDQQDLCKALVAKALSDANGGGEDDDENEEEDMPAVSHNAFDMGMGYVDPGYVDEIAHDAFATIVSEGRANGGSVKDFYLAHASEIDEEYGIHNIGLLMEDYHLNNTRPEEIRDKDTTWVDKVVDNVTETLYSMNKSIYADMRDENAMKARGYITTHRKKETAFAILNRVTAPWTMYIKSKMDRDQMIDLEESGLDYVPFVKDKMQERMKELKAKCYLIGDGLSKLDEDHVNEDCIRPILTDDALFSRKILFEVKQADDEETRLRKFIKSVRKMRKKYHGTGSPSLFVPEGLIEDLLNIENPLTHEYQYEDEQKLCRVLRVKEIIPVDAMVGLKMTDNDADSTTYNEQGDLWAIMVNMRDYTVGMNKMGRTALFEDFDIDFNQMKWLYETRQSGSLMKAFSALVFGMKEVA